MKTSKIFSLEVDTVRELVQRAAEIGVTHSALADLLLRGGLEKLPAEKLQAWARAQREAAAAARGPSSRLTRAEVIARDALQTEWQTFAELRAATGQGIGVLHRALHNLAGHGLAEQATTNNARDAKGRAINSTWRLKGGA